MAAPPAPRRRARPQAGLVHRCSRDHAAANPVGGARLERATLAAPQTPAVVLKANSIALTIDAVHMRGANLSTTYRMRSRRMGSDQRRLASYELVGYQVGPHHLVVLMREDVAMPDVFAGAVEGRRDTDGLARPDPDRVLPAQVRGGEPQRRANLHIAPRPMTTNRDVAVAGHIIRDAIFV